MAKTPAFPRGTTPTVPLVVPIDITDMDQIRVTFKYAGGKMTKTGSDIEVTPFEDGGVSKTRIEVPLSQRDTLDMRAGSSCMVQIRACKDGGAVAIATRTKAISVDEILEEGFIGGFDG